jgi:hypothetical protein
MGRRNAPAPADRSRGRLRRGSLKLLLAAGSVLATCLALELAFRGWLALRGRAYDRVAVEAQLRREANTMEAFVPGTARNARTEHLAGRVLHPYTGSENYPDTGGVLAYFRKGVPEDVYTVVVVGGSVAAGWSADVERVFRDRLEADPRLAGRRVEILPYAHAAYKQPQQLMRIAYLFSFGYRPDAVLNLDGFNEVANGVQNSLVGTHPLYPTSPVWGGLVGVLTSNPATGASAGEAFDTVVELRALGQRARRLVERTLDAHLAVSSLLGRYALSRLDGINARRAELQHRLAILLAQPTGGSKGRKQRNFELLGPRYPKSFDRVLQMSVRCWYEGSLSIDALCDARGVYYLHCLQPTLHDTGSKPLTDAERALNPGPEGWKPAVEAGYPLLRAAGRELVAHGVSFADTSRCLSEVKETVYVDACHFNDTGNVAISRAIADAFLEHMP